MKHLKFNQNFKINGTSFSSVEDLLEYSKTESIATQKFLREWFSDKKFVEVKTSGSTGKPKMIQLKKEFMKNSAKATGQFFKLFENTTALLCMSTEYIAGKMMLVRALELGWYLDIVTPASNPLKNIDKVYDFSAMVPMQLQYALNDIEKVKKLIVGGGVVSNELETAIQEISTEIYATFGMTETITHIAVRKLNFFTDQSENYYQTLPNVSISLDDRNCLVINAPKVSDVVIKTNDVVELISDTEFKWLGRFDNVINSGGIKLHPEEIEKKLSEVISSRFFVAGIPDSILGEKLVLIIEGKQRTVILSEAKNLSKYEIPKHIYFVDQFIETATKKIQRLKTLDLFSL
jgi:O-succinylbenzoic acid--CoA ligase